MLVDIINEQIRRGHDVALVVINNNYSDDILAKVSAKARIVLLKRPPASKNPLIAFQLNWQIWRFNPNVIHLHNESICRILFSKRPCFLTVHNLGIDLPSYCKRLDELIAISNAVEEDISNRYPDQYKVKTIPNGILVDDIKRKKDYSTNNGVLQIVQVASIIIKKKGQDILLEALALLKERNIEQLEVTFIGEPYDGDILIRLAREKGLEDRVHIIGIKDRDYIYNHLQEFHLMCHPSRIEGFGLAVAEGILAGLPVLVPDAEGPYEIIQYGKLGYTFKKEDPVSLADALQDIYEHYPVRVKQVVDAAFYHVKANYSVQHMVEQYIEEYKLHCAR